MENLQRRREINWSQFRLMQESVLGSELRGQVCLDGKGTSTEYLYFRIVIYFPRKC
jgi:hypothetical protein